MRRDYRGREGDHVREIVELDLVDIDGSDVVLANCANPSWGTAMEIRYAWETRKSVHAVVPPGRPVSPWLRYHCAGIHEDLDAAIDACLTFIGTLNRR
jgi:nucleoside 2-deoxyribosyltransferase